MKKIFFASMFLLLSIASCSQKVSFLSLSEKIYEKNGSQQSVFKLNRYKRDARKKIYSNEGASFLRGKIDTLYLLEGYNIETGTFYCTIWDKENSISYSYFREKLEVQSRSVFTEHQILLVTRWDVPAIRKEEDVNGNWLDNNLQINAFRCYKEGRDWRVEEISFKNFYDPKRDH
ncbi:hypothetical protein [Pedobacter helvus]|uniref:DUF4348 domain-containing protein n=1 Tax=Pedobacter helvus TaxID=2563444 RepID=A0ABW9JCH3_9SPHI|nr:hypothetical protein [Pedobacter ureilyticus]